MIIHAEKPDPVLALMPPHVREAIPTVRWRRDELWSLALPIEPVAIAGLAWLFDLPIWKDAGQPWQVTPNQVRADPMRYVEHFRRAMICDLSYPIHLYKHNGRWTVLDGFHRLLKADLQGR